MTSNRPYLVRAMHAWIIDNGLTPYLLVDANGPGVRVPPSAIKDGRVVLSIAPRAVAQFDIGLESVRFLARFGGVSHSIEVPMPSILAIYAQENGQGMMFQAEREPTPPPPSQPEPESSEGPRRPQLRIVK